MVKKTTKFQFTGTGAELENVNLQNTFTCRYAYPSHQLEKKLDYRYKTISQMTPNLLTDECMQTFQNRV